MRATAGDVDAGVVAGVVVDGPVVVVVGGEPVVVVLVGEARGVGVLVTGTAEVDELAPLPAEHAPSMTTAHIAPLSRDTFAPMFYSLAQQSPRRGFTARTQAGWGSRGPLADRRAAVAYIGADRLGRVTDPHSTGGGAA
jgi:hypothetical protein